jgi:CSLREA domain-containing protein
MNAVRRKNMALTAGLLLTLVAACVLLAAAPAHAKTFTVNTKADSGDQKPGDGKCFTGQNTGLVGPECTLRAAIQEANKFPGADTIAFNIIGFMGSGLRTIEVGKTGNGALPTITGALTIDGYTQLGATKNTLTQPGRTDAVLNIELDGANAGFSDGLEIRASNVVVRGLVINSFGSSGIWIVDSTGTKIAGNFIGTDSGGTLDEGNGTGVFFSNADGTTLGGTWHEARNVISGNSIIGVRLYDGSSGNKIQGNLIGTDKNGTGDLGNDHLGVAFVSSSKNTIGDSDPTDGLTNAANTIAFNTRDGVGVDYNSTGNRILSNSIFSNNDPSTTDSELGISLRASLSDPNIVTLNDPKDPDTGSNRLQNYPVLSFAQEGFDNTTSIGGDLNSTPSTRKKTRIFSIQFFSNPSTDPNEGKTFLGQRQVKTDRQGNASVGFSTSAVSEGEYITATATNKATGDTSEFSQARVVEGPVIGGG